MQGGREAILELLQQPEMCAFLSACGLSHEMLERMALAAAAQAARSAQDRSACNQLHLHDQWPLWGNGRVALSLAMS